MAAIEFLKKEWKEMFSVKKLTLTLRRFPLAILYTTVLALWAIEIFLNKRSPSNLERHLMYYLATGSLISVALKLWKEEVPPEKKKWGWGIVVTVHLLWAANVLYLYLYADHISIGQIIGNGASIFCMVAAVFLGSFWRNKSEIAFHTFSSRVLGETAKALIVSLIFYLGVSLLLVMLRVLLGLDLRIEFYLTTAVIAAWLCLLFFLNHLPLGLEKHKEDYYSSRFAIVLTRYLINPLLCAYLTVLYVYLLKILFTWTLPNGGVVWFVTALMVGIMISLSLTYPQRMTQPNAWDRFSSIWIPRLTIPLLILMSVAITRRLNDYGVTVQRLYVVIFNGWCYFALLYIILSKGTRLKMLVTSFSLVLLITSVGWQNLTHVTSMILQKEITATYHTGERQPKLPMDKEGLDEWLGSMDKRDAANMKSKLFYLKDIDQKASAQFIHKDLNSWDFSRYNLHSNRAYDVEESPYISLSLGEDLVVDIPAGYKHMEKIKFVNKGPFDVKKCQTMRVCARDLAKDSIWISLNFAQIEELNQLDVAQQDLTSPIQIPVSDSIQVFINEIVMSPDWSDRSKKIYDSVSIQGYLFRK